MRRATTQRRRTARSFLSSRNGAEPGGAIRGSARLGRRTKDLVKHLTPADIAIIDHTNIDRMAAEDLIASGVQAIVNVSPSTNGRYPNAGPLLLTRAGVRLIDAPGAPLFERLSDGDEVTIEGGRVLAAGTELANGHVLETEQLDRQLGEQRERIGEALEAFAENTMSHILQERELLAGRIEFPPTRTQFRDRHVLIVVRGPTYRKDLKALSGYIRDVKPVLVGVDGGADAILEEGLKPHMVLGDMDSASDEVLRCGAELIVHAYASGKAPGRERLQALGVPHTVVPSVGTSEDVAMLLAYEHGAGLIVSVGAHFNLIEFLEKNREGMSSTFLTRLRIGETLVDAKGVSRLYNPGVTLSHMALFMGAAVVLMVILLIGSPALDNLLELFWLKIQVLLGL
ncbi:MAG: hypothetical protein QOG09_1566 [Solirubrobacterales bacterium]|jgi:uncharacterized membrane-anchored protein|nr:hypothetical protein [Solirubrobacterales bacterium]MDX6652618.1 hypothetical protein [Solirubrobacterales bacterium]MDX6663464.1 hypothetical protein [Solirubrobacterales bacterium]